MKKIKVLGLSLAVISTLGFTGCGGGGGSSSSGGSSLSFPSNAVNAEPTIENGEKVEKVVAQNQQSSYAINAVSSSNNQNIALTMKKITDTIKIIDIDKNTYSLNETINETESCPSGGTMNYSGSGSETGGATITITFDNCSQYGILMDGKILTNMSNYNSTYDDYTTVNMTFLSDFKTSGTGVDGKITNGSTTKTEFSDITELNEANNMKMTISAISEMNGVKTGQKDAVYYFDLSSYSNPSMYQTSGKIYIDNLTSYVTYDTSYDMSQTPFVFSNSGLNSGEARYNMTDGAKVKIVAEAGEAKTYVDADGDGIYELSE